VVRLPQRHLLMQARGTSSRRWVVLASASMTLLLDSSFGRRGGHQFRGEASRPRVERLGRFRTRSVDCAAGCGAVGPSRDSIAATLALSRRKPG
jgi:hypothetical protein